METSALPSSSEISRLQDQNTAQLLLTGCHSKAHIRDQSNFALVTEVGPECILLMDSMKIADSLRLLFRMAPE